MQFLTHQFQPPKSIRHFFWRILAWVPIAFAAWYLISPLLHWPLRWFLSGMAMLGIPEFVSGVGQTMHGFEFLTTLTPGAVAGQAFRPDAVVSTEVDARLYTYGSGLLAALTLAAWDKHRWRNLWYGWLALLPFQMLAVFAVGMKQIILDLGTSVQAQVEWASWQIEVIAYLYQFSTLIMPPVTALAVWLLLHRAFVERFVGADVIALIRATEKKKTKTNNVRIQA
jgi:hypothetical protein